MSELDVEKLRRLRDRRWEPGLTEPAAIGELQAALPAITAALDQGEDYRLRLKASNTAYIEITKKLDAALEDRDRLEAGLIEARRVCREFGPLSDVRGQVIRIVDAALERRDG